MHVMMVVDKVPCVSPCSTLLGSDLSVVLDVDVVVGRKGVYLVLGELGTAKKQSAAVQTSQVCEGTDVKPLISLNSVVILPPWSVTCFLAL